MLKKKKERKEKKKGKTPKEENGGKRDTYSVDTESVQSALLLAETAVIFPSSIWRTVR
jgi:hypothetical protein